MKKLLIISALSLFCMNLNAEESKQDKDLLNRIDTTFQKFNQLSTIKDISSGELDATLKNFEQLLSDLKDAKQKELLKEHKNLLKNSIDKIERLINKIKERQQYSIDFAKYVEARDSVQKKVQNTMDSAKRTGLKVHFGPGFTTKLPQEPQAPDYQEPLWHKINDVSDAIEYISSWPIQSKTWDVCAIEDLLHDIKKSNETAKKEKQLHNIIIDDSVIHQIEGFLKKLKNAGITCKKTK